jgi:hypothetical protein
MRAESQMVRDKIRRFETPFQVMAIQAISSAAALRKAHTASEASAKKSCNVIGGCDQHLQSTSAINIATNFCIRESLHW